MPGVHEMSHEVFVVETGSFLLEQFGLRVQLISPFEISYQKLWSKNRLAVVVNIHRLIIWNFQIAWATKIHSLNKNWRCYEIEHLNKYSNLLI